ncbi:hypothetical protein CCO03_09790 [Comamonas serinivorans]|uniref:Uncharacterized protein n=1 Tax=Comamonas serinivorans TaxID=1082851 RepID=A0A1Y0EMS0_9BURK|nr:hypothetical protein [Comamonas serinivorans]ARU04933.1 hypothetical protein CCO03_09790 [Comamonas serinivorans]
MGGEFNLVGTLLMVGFAAFSAWLGRKLATRWQEKKRRDAEQAARASESRQVRRARERRNRPDDR